jgi:FkbM family methyltransferase
MKLGNILDALPFITACHARDNPVYKVFEGAIESRVRKDCLDIKNISNIDLGELGEIIFPYHKMGAIDTLDLFGLDELIIFSYYWANRERYSKAIDIGANLGLHTILMAKCGWSVNAYEPDPNHSHLLEENLKLNNSCNVNFFESAVSDVDGTLEFVRVLGNTTGSHLSGAKASPYGELERFPVRVAGIEAVMSGADFIKMDVEGQEAVILLSTNAEQWDKTDMILEIGSIENANKIYQHISSLGVRLFAQKIGWNQVQSIEDMPANYKEGSLFITSRKEMLWGEQ